MSLPPALQARSSGTDLAEHLSLLRRRKLLFLCCLLAAVAAALGLWRLVPPSYTATTEVLVAPVGVQEQNNQVTSRQREALNLDTEARIAQSAVVATEAAESLKIPAAEPAEVSVPPNSSVLAIAVTAADPETAAAQSRAYARAYLSHRTESAQTALAAQQKALLGKLKQVNSALGDTAEQVTKLRRGTASHAVATHRQSVLNRQALSLTMKYDGLKTVALTPGTVISEAATPAAPSAPSLPLYLGAGLMLGLLAGSAAAYGRDRLDTRLRRAADVERLTGVAVLADLSDQGKVLDRLTLHDLASSVVAACPGKRLLVRVVPPGPGAYALAAPLASRAPLSVLDGADVGDLAKADAAMLLITLRRSRAGDVAAAVRHLGRHNVPIIGAVTSTGDLPEPPEKSRALPKLSQTLDKLVVPAPEPEKAAFPASERPAFPAPEKAAFPPLEPETTPMPAVTDKPGKTS
ncbi:Wzz/FepE/Etk N-terminal domain-containing protein [Nonomuraea sp. NPDC050790]|uniref:Wzz/FepE/Etk N-terminal domain-containing protein n=1 Tax=Nonomuraea sp. NPDC050790 TaxID=3364371 RepID=UPI00378732EF